MATKKIIHCIPGLGANHMMWRNQEELPFELRHIEMIVPDREDTLSSYAKKLMDQFDLSQPIRVMGVSMGGMLTTEISRILHVDKALVISGCKTRSELPGMLRFFGNSPINRMFSSGLSKNMLQKYALHMSDMPEAHKFLYCEMVETHHDEFLRWAPGAIMKWENEEVPKSVIHIHGDQDKVLPYRYVKADITIEGGSHYMISAKAAELNELIQTSFS